MRVAEKVELLAARALGAAERHRFYGSPLPHTLQHPRNVLVRHATQDETANLTQDGRAFVLP